MTQSRPTSADQAVVALDSADHDVDLGWTVCDVLRELSPLADSLKWADGRDDLAASAWFGTAVLEWLDAMMPVQRVYMTHASECSEMGSQQELATVAIALASYLIIGDQATASEFQRIAVKQLTSWLPRTYGRVAATLDWYEFFWLRGEWVLSRPNDRIQEAAARAIKTQQLLPSVPAATAFADASQALISRLHYALGSDSRFEYQPASTRGLGDMLEAVLCAGRGEALNPGMPQATGVSRLVRPMPIVDAGEPLFSQYLIAVSSFAGFVEPYVEADIDAYRRIYTRAVFPYAHDPTDPDVMARIRWEPTVGAAGFIGLDRKVRDEIGELSVAARAWKTEEVQRFSQVFRIASLRTLCRHGWPSAPDVERLQERWDLLASVLPCA